MRFAENGKRLGVEFSGLSKNVADFLFSGSGKCQIRQRLLTELHREMQTDCRLPSGLGGYAVD